MDPGLSVATQPRKNGSEEVIIIDDSSDEEQEEVQQGRRTNGETSNGFGSVPSALPSSGMNIARPVAAAEVQQQPLAGGLNSLNNPPPPPRMASPAFTQPSPAAASVRPIMIPHRAPIISE